jgi:hypothetical protein
MTDADDPLTGEKVAASINIWTATTDVAAQQLVDIVRYMNGEISTDQITNGSYVTSWAGAAKLGGGGGLPTLPKSDIDRRLAGIANLDLGTSRPHRGGPGPELKARSSRERGSRADVGARNDIASRPRSSRLDAGGRPRRVRRGPVNPAILQLAGPPATARCRGGRRSDRPAFNNPLAAARPAAARERPRARGACLIDAAPRRRRGRPRRFPPGVPRRAQQSPRPAEPLRRHVPHVQRRYHYAGDRARDGGIRSACVTTSSQLGAAVLSPQYWRLRPATAVTAACTDAVDDGAAASAILGPGDARGAVDTIWMDAVVGHGLPGDSRRS